MADDGGENVVHDWSAFRDDEGQIYYHNSKTDETSWEPPPNDEPFNPVEEEAGKSNGQTETGTSNDQTEAEAAVSGDWVEYMDEDKGEPYYYNTVTNETVWERPAGFVGKDEPSKSPKSTPNDGDQDQIETKVKTESQEPDADAPVVEDTATAIGDWVETQDEEGRTYYYNSKTEETSWDRPAGIKEEEKEDKVDANKSTTEGMSENETVKKGDWTEVQDDEGRTYYYNEKTEETSWDRPAGFDDESKDNNDNTAQQEQQKDEGATGSTETKASGDWVEAQDDEGRTYYYNEKTEETSWERPAEFETTNKIVDTVEDHEKNEGVPVAAEAEKSGDWVEAQDDEGRTYYYNAKTEETSWEKPSGFIENDDNDTKQNEGKNEDVSDKDAGADWVETQDDEGRTYYYNTKTEETSWDQPAALEKNDVGVSPERPKSPLVGTKMEDEADIKKDKVTSDDTENEAASNWVETQDDEGRTYYYNTKTEETTWEKPPGFDTRQKDPSGISPDRPKSPSLGQEEDDTGPVVSGNWVEYKDDEGRFYYYNTETEQTVWDKPADFDDAVEKSIARGDSDEDDGGDKAMELSPARAQSPDGASPVPMEEEEEEVVDPAVKRLEEAKEALSQSDAIMETGILSDLTEVVKNDGGNPKNAIQALSESAHGQTAVCGLLSRWLADLKSQTSSSPSTTDAATHTKRFRKSADDIREMTQAEINRIVKERFTHKGGDNILALSKSEAAFLEDMMDSNRWRKLLIDLSASNKDSALLMYCLQSISKRGHHREIARRINQSEHFPVFNAMLASELAVIGKISVSTCHDHDTSISLNELVGDLRRICTSTSYTYLYGFEVLRFQIRKAKSDSLAMPEKDRLLYARVIRKWERLLEVLQGDMIDPSTSTGNTGNNIQLRKRRLDVATTMGDLYQRQRRRFYPEKASDENDHSFPTDTPFVNNDTNDRRKEIESAISAFLRKYCLGAQMDIRVLDNILPKSESEQESDFIGNLLVDYPIAIEALLGYLYKPGQRVEQIVLRRKCARLTAIAVLASERQSLEEARKIDPKISKSESDENTLTEMLMKGSKLCEQLESMVSFIVTTDATKTNGSATSPGEQICSLAVKCAPVSQGVAMWAREITRGGEFVSSASYASISPNIMTLVRIVYLYHPFTRDDVCHVAFQFLKHANSEVAYQTMNSLKEQSLRLLLFLCTRGEAPSVFDQLKKLLNDPGRSSLDASLIRYFISGLLEIASPPFSIPFIRSLLTLLKSPASVDAVKATYFDKKSKDRLLAIMNYLRKLDAKPLAKQDVSLINSVLSIYHPVSK